MRRPRLRILAALLLYQLVFTSADRPPEISDGHLEKHENGLTVNKNYNDDGEKQRIMSEETRTSFRGTRILGKRQSEDSCPKDSRMRQSTDLLQRAERRVEDRQTVAARVHETRLEETSSRLMNRRKDSIEVDRRSAERREVRRSLGRVSDIRRSVAERRSSDSLRRTVRSLDEKLVRDMQRRVDMGRTVNERRAADQQLTRDSNEDSRRRADLRSGEDRRETRMENARRRIARRSIDERRFADSLRRTDERLTRNTQRDDTMKEVNGRRSVDGSRMTTRQFDDRSRDFRMEERTNRVMKRSVEGERSERRALVERMEQSAQYLSRSDRRVTDRSARDERRVIENLQTDRLARDETPRRIIRKSVDERRVTEGLRTDRMVDNRLVRDSTPSVSFQRTSKSVEERRSVSPVRRVDDSSVRHSRMDDSQRRLARSTSGDSARTERRVEERKTRDLRMMDSQRRMARSRSLDTSRIDHRVGERRTRESSVEDSQREVARSRTEDTARSDRHILEQVSPTEDTQRRITRSRSEASARTERRVEERLTRDFRTENSQLRIARSRFQDNARTDRRVEERLTRNSRNEDSRRQIARSGSEDTRRASLRIAERRDSRMEDTQGRIARIRSGGSTQAERPAEERVTRDSRIENSQRRLVRSRSEDTTRRITERRESRMEDSQRRISRSRSVDSARTYQRAEEKLTRDLRMEDPQRRTVRHRSLDDTRREERIGNNLVTNQRIDDSEQRRVDLRRSDDRRSAETLTTTRITEGRVIRDSERRVDTRRTVDRRTDALQRTGRRQEARLALQERSTQISTRRTEDRSSVQRRQLESDRRGYENDRRTSEILGDRRSTVTVDQRYDEARQISTRRSLSMTREQNRRVEGYLSRGSQKLDHEGRQLDRKQYSEKRDSGESRATERRESPERFNLRVATRSAEDRRFIYTSGRREERVTNRRERLTDLREDRAIIALRNLNRYHSSDRTLSRIDGVVLDMQSPKERTDVTRRESLTGWRERATFTGLRQSSLRSDAYRTRASPGETEDRRLSSRNALQVPERRSRELGGSRRELPAQNRRDMRSNNGERIIYLQDGLSLENDRASYARSRRTGRGIHYKEEVKSNRNEEGVRLERLVPPYIIQNKGADINNNELGADLQRWTPVRLGKTVYKALADFINMNVPQNRLTAKVQEYGEDMTVEDKSSPSHMMSGLLAGAVLLLTARQAPVK